MVFKLKLGADRGTGGKALVARLVLLWLRLNVSLPWLGLWGITNTACGAAVMMEKLFELPAASLAWFDGGFDSAWASGENAHNNAAANPPAQLWSGRAPGFFDSNKRFTMRSVLRG